MKKNIIKCLTVLVLVVLAGFAGVYIYKNIQITRSAGELNICINDELIAKLIENNKNPFSKFKFLKKRNNDCKVLLISNKDEATEKQNNAMCPILNGSTSSIIMLTDAYVNNMYDRETASKEMNLMLNLMTPYNFCDDYYNDIMTLITLKKRLGL